ncbi:amino acid adenylation domain-containing protein [Aureisphaera galaxeae]|uniref:non-ribosomal peptide synthetase n=1 Tax=Aureisphaera galaxeae TaxID=1538023 RepID=UPI00235027D7|nr:non-ribosomal peptide synthetase [Aureisphaera galaxeae]MDC8004732.1 amino acid adenylation domain-containing protein [Aureisphaera galaxeae]
MNNKVIHYAFEQVAAANPEAVAVKTESSALSYADLNANANRLADLLVQRNCKKDDIVAAFLNEPIAQLVSLLGIFKAGSIYLPVDVKYNQNHWESLFMDICPKVIVLSQENFELLNSYDETFQYSIPEAIVPEVDADGSITFSVYVHNGNTYEKEEQNIELSIENPVVTIDKDDANYIFFTSGSTGKPKAVLGKHQSLAHFISWVNNAFEITEKDNIGLVASFSFDASLHDIFAAFTNGCTLFVPSSETKEDIFKLQQWIKEEEITVLHMVPTLFRLISSSYVSKPESCDLQFPSLRYMLLAGEKLYGKDVTAWRTRFGNRTEIVNLYGTTETTCLSTFYRIEDTEDIGPSDVFCVGQPISNTMILVLNQNNELCRVNETGSVYIRTPYTTQGYYKNPEQTNLRFVQNPLTSKKDMIYKTGDYGKYDADRNVIILGREDSIVKVSGVRVDVNSIEATILELEQVDMVKCILRQDQDNNFNIACFFKSDVMEIEDIRRHCLQFLSHYEVPSVFVKLDDFPKNTSGKIDAVALEKSLETPQLGGDNSRPMNETEEQLASIWKEILEVAPIGATDDFLLLGGNSIRLIKLKVKIHKEFDVSLSINELFTSSRLEDQARLISGANISDFESIPKVDLASNYPLSSAQYRLWVLSQLEKGSIAYNIPFSTRLEITDMDSFESAVIHVIERHEVLRTVFKKNKEGEVRQWVYNMEDLAFSIDYQDYQGLENANELAKQHIAADVQIPFDLETGPLLRMGLIQLSENEYIFHYNMHHIISDGKSKELLSRDVMTAYEAYRTGQEPKLPALKIQYKDYAAWQLQQLESESFKEHQSFWKQHLAGELPFLDLPSSKVRPLAFDFGGHCLATSLTPDATTKLKDYCSERGGTLFMGILSLWKLLFHKYTQQTDIIIGSPVEGRDHIDLKDQIGFYVNTLIHRNTVNPSESFNDFFERLKENTIASFNHQMYPYDRLAEDLNIIRDASRSAIFDVLIVLQNDVASENRRFTKGESYGTIVDRGVATSKFDLEIELQEVGGSLNFQIVYNTAIYEKERIIGLLDHFQQLVNAVLEAPEAKIGEIDYLSQEETNLLLTEFNDTQVDFGEDQILDLFETQVRRNPDAIALTYNGEEVSYGTLDRKSNQLAHYLAQEGLEEMLIPICIDRSPELIVAILGILKSGNAFVPIAANFPQDRVNYILDDTKASLVICSESNAAKFESITTVDLSHFPFDQYPWDAPEVPYVNEQPAYCIYTSGTTGRPKGVLISRDALTNYIQYASETYTDRESLRFILVTSVSFDLTITSIFTPLVTGGSIEIIPEFKSDVEALELVARKEFDVIKLTPSHLDVLVDFRTKESGMDTQKKRVFILGGEQLSKNSVAKLFTCFGNNSVIWNEYGPTESTVGCIAKRITSEDEGEILIGKPTSNTQAYIMKEDALLPVGVTGEIYIGGSQLAMEYLNNKELTDSKFVPSPFAAGEKLYRTGDLGRWLPCGNMEYLGRLDEQVKIRGYRIELAEIEFYLKKRQEIKSAVVTTVENKESELELAVYFVADQELDLGKLRLYLSYYLPAYMLPDYFIAVDEIPLTSNGKVDYAALPEPSDTEVSSGVEYVAPENELEEKLVEIVASVLDRNAHVIGTHDNFFDLGMNSIKLLKVLNSINSIFNLTLNISMLFDSPNVHFIANEIDLILKASQLQNQEKRAKTLKI